MTAFLERESATDSDLIAAARGGEQQALAELYTRHHDAATRYARRLADPTTAEDLVADAFAKVLATLRTGGGPTVAFRPYLLRTVHNVYVNHVRRDSRHAWVDDLEDLDRPMPVDPATQRQESALLASAFASLPERWQAVLWHTAVEGDDHATVGRLLGIKANAVAALAFRSREGLRRAYLEQHLGAVRDEACRPYREQLVPYARGRVRGRRRDQLEHHLEHCADCTAGYLELQTLAGDLGALLAPAVLGAGAATYAVGAATGSAGGPGGALGLARRSRRTTTVAVAAAAVVVATAAAGLAWAARDPGPAAPPGRSADGALDAADPPAAPSASSGPAPSGRPAPETPRPSHSAAAPSSRPGSAAPLAPVRPPAPPALGALLGLSSSPSPTAPPITRPPGPQPGTPTPTSTPSATPTSAPRTHEDLALGAGSHTYFGPHHHVQMTVTSPLESTVVTLAVARLDRFTVHDEAAYRSATCTRDGDGGEGRSQVRCVLAPGSAPFAVDLVVTGDLDVVARVSAADNDDPDPSNDVLAFGP